MTVAVVTGGAVTVVTGGIVATVTGGATRVTGAARVAVTTGADTSRSTLVGTAQVFCAEGFATVEVTMGVGAAGYDTEEPTYFTAGSTSTLPPATMVALPPHGGSERLPPPQVVTGLAAWVTLGKADAAV